MKYGYTPNMTQEMIDILPDVEFFENEIKLCSEKLSELDGLEISLPRTGVNGKPMLHYCRYPIYNLRIYWKNRLHEAKLLI